MIIGEAERGDQQSDREARRLRGLAERLGVADRLRVHAHATDAEIPELLRSTDVVACTPTYEPSGVVALEATACGVPVVACAVGPLPDIVVHEVTGFLVTAKIRGPRGVGQPPAP